MRVKSTEISRLDLILDHIAHTLKTRSNLSLSIDMQSKRIIFED